MKSKNRLTVSAALLLVWLFLFSNGVYSQQIIPFESGRWEISGRESRVIEHLGRQSLSLKGGLAVVKDSNFTDGIIEFDISFTGERGFMGMENTGSHNPINKI